MRFQGHGVDVDVLELTRHFFFFFEFSNFSRLTFSIGSLTGENDVSEDKSPFENIISKHAVLLS